MLVLVKAPPQQTAQAAKGNASQATQSLLNTGGDGGWRCRAAGVRLVGMAGVGMLGAAGQMVATGGLSPDTRRLISSGDEMTVIDGPFTETKEAVVGFALIDCESWGEALELAKRFRRIVGDGESTIQEVFGP